VPELIRAWSAPDTNRTLVVRFDGFEMRFPLSCVATARAKVAALGD
jgi:hypothetical protein